MLPATFTSFDITSATVQESAPVKVKQNIRHVQESAGSYNIDFGQMIGPNWGLWGGDQNLNGRYGGWWPADRVLLPNHAPTGFFAEPQWRAGLSWARYICDRNKLAIGFLETVSNFIGAMTVQFVRRDANPADAGNEAEDDPLIKELTQFWKEWTEANEWGKGTEDRECEMRKRSIRDGEVWLRFGPGGREQEYLPWVRFIEPEQVRQPSDNVGLIPDYLRPFEADMNTQWGVFTSVQDCEYEYGINVGTCDSGGAVSEFLDRSKYLRIKLNVDRCIKRGLSDFFALEEDLQNVHGLLRNMLVTGKAQAAVAWLERYASSTPEQVRHMLYDQATGFLPPQGVNQGYGPAAGPLPVTGPYATGEVYRRPLPMRENPGGTVIGAEQSRQFDPGPASTGVSSWMEIVNRTTELCGFRWGIPGHFTGASAGSFAEALVEGSPFVRATETRQHKFQGLTRNLALKMVSLAERSGRLPMGTSQLIDAVITPKPVIMSDLVKQVGVWDIELRNKVLDPQTWIRKQGRDPKIVVSNIKQWEAEFPQPQMGEQPGGGNPNEQPPQDSDSNPPGSAGGDGSEDDGYLNFGGDVMESLVYEHGMTGTVTDKLGRTIHFVDGERVKTTEPAPAQRSAAKQKPQPQQRQPAKQSVKPAAKPVAPKIERAKATRGEMTAASRVGTGKDAKIVLADGQSAPDHIKPSMVPPDWKNVQIALDPTADLLVTGRDSKGKPKSVYSDNFHMRAAAVKFARVKEGLDKAREIYDENQNNRKDENMKDLADAVWLMQEQATRPGSEADTKGYEKLYSQKMTPEMVVENETVKGKKVALGIRAGDTVIPIRDKGTAARLLEAKKIGDLKDVGYWAKSHGATTIEGRHIVDGKDGVRLQFVGKEGVWHDHLIRNPELAKMLSERAKSAGPNGKLFGVDYDKVSDYTKRLDGGKFSPKDFRTVRATQLAIDTINKMSAPKNDKEYKVAAMEVAKKVSGVLGNRPPQALESYIDPTVFSGWRAGLSGAASQ